MATLRLRPGQTSVICSVCRATLPPRVPGYRLVPEHPASCGSPCTGGGASKGHPYACGCTSAAVSHGTTTDGVTSSWRNPSEAGPCSTRGGFVEP